MQKMTRVSGLKRVSELNSYLDALPDFYAALAHEEFKCPPVNVFHRKERPAIFAFADFVNDANVWMIEARSGFGFGLKALTLIRIPCHLHGHQFDGHETLQARILCKENLAHAAPPYLADHAVM